MTKLDLKKFDEITMNFSKLSPVMVVGDIGVDKYTDGEVNRISPEAPVPVLEVKREWMKLGLAANISDNLAVMNIKSLLVGVVGEDKNADSMRTLMRDKNLSTSGLVSFPDRMTTFKERITTNMQQLCRVDYESKHPISTFEEDRIKSKLQKMDEDSTSLIIEDYGKGMLTKSLISFLVDYSNDRNMHLAVDPSRTTPPIYYKGAGLFKPNKVEAQIICEQMGFYETDVSKQALFLLDKLDLKQIVITLGAEGMAVMDRCDGKLKITPTLANEVYDVSGAGDTVIALISSSLASGADLEQAAWIANCAAGVVVAKKGTATVSLHELRDFFLEISRKLK